MNHVTILSAVSALFVTLSAAYAVDDLGTLKGFETAFRRSYDRHDIHRLESLFCWDGTTSVRRRQMHSFLIKEFGRTIDSIEITPFTNRAAPKWWEDPSVKPEYVFTVWYSYDRPRFMFYPYLIGRKRGKFCFIVWRRPVLLPTYAPSR